MIPARLRDTRRRSRGAVRLALRAILAAAVGMAAIPACAAHDAGRGASVGPGCELHVWGVGRPNGKVSTRLMKQIDPAQLDRSNPLSNVNLFSTVNRANALPDDELKKLLPQADRVTIVRHPEVIDIDRTPLKGFTGPIAPGATGCYADLVIANLYGIFPNPGAAWEKAGLVGLALAGSDRLVIEFWLRDYSGPAAGGKIYKRKNDSPLPHVPFMTAEMKTALEASAVVNLRSFVEFVDRQRVR